MEYNTIVSDALPPSESLSLSASIPNLLRQVSAEDYKDQPPPAYSEVFCMTGKSGQTLDLSFNCFDYLPTYSEAIDKTHFQMLL